MTFIGLFLKSIFIMVLMVAIFLIGIVSFIMSMRCLAPGTTSRWVIIWLAIVVVFSLGTMDLIGLALYSITLVIYLARNKAIAAQQAGLVLYEAGHYHTELPYRERLKAYLDTACPGVEFIVSESERPPMGTL